MEKALSVLDNLEDHLRWFLVTNDLILQHFYEKFFRNHHCAAGAASLTRLYVDDLPVNARREEIKRD